MLFCARSRIRVFFHLIVKVLLALIYSTLYKERFIEVFLIIFMFLILVDLIFCFFIIKPIMETEILKWKK